jgi:hypothetical protein
MVSAIFQDSFTRPPGTNAVPRRSYSVQDTVYGYVRNHEAEIRLFSGRRAEGRPFENGGRYEKSLPQIRSHESWLLVTR